MSYIITTYRDAPYDIGASRVAVATLEDAIRSLYGSLNVSVYYDEHARAIKALSESGGTIGPLPDGTTIEVSPA